MKKELANIIFPAVMWSNLVHATEHSRAWYGEFKIRFRSDVYFRLVKNENFKNVLSDMDVVIL